MIPPFRPNGNLPSGIHIATWEEFVARYEFSIRRKALMIGLLAALHALKNAGCHTVYIDGSFVTTKQEPNDYDACWDIVEVEIGQLDPVFLDFNNGRASQKSKYLGEFSPAQLP